VIDGQERLQRHIIQEKLMKTKFAAISGLTLICRPRRFIDLPVLQK
jgi:hypothetical protein